MPTNSIYIRIFRDFGKIKHLTLHQNKSLKSCRLGRLIIKPTVSWCSGGLSCTPRNQVSTTSLIHIQPGTYRTCLPTLFHSSYILLLNLTGLNQTGCRVSNLSTSQQNVRSPLQHCISFSAPLPK